MASPQLRATTAALGAAGLAALLAAGAGSVVLAWVAAGVAALLATGLMVGRARRTPSEAAVWYRWAGAAGGVTLGSLVVAGGLPLVGTLVTACAFPFAYGAGVRWNRYATTLADPHELMNGVASAIAVVAACDLTVQLTGGAPVDLPWQQRVAVWVPLACAFIVAGTLLAVIPAAALRRDPRAWLVLTAVLGLVGLFATPFLVPGPVTPAAAIAVCAVLGGTAAALDPRPGPPQPVDASASTIGGFAILVLSVGMLATASWAGVHGLPVWCAATAAAVSGVRLLRNVRDISTLAVTQREALTDELTGVPNRRALLRRAEELLARGPVVLALVDLDDFKQINDGLGHSAGDDLLRATAHRLVSVLGPGDVLGRLGGDEFAVVGPVPRGTSAPARLARLGADLVTVLGEPVEVGGVLVHGSGSVGTTTSVPGSGADVSELLRQADAAMYEAKATRGTAVAYDPARHAPHGQLLLLEELRTALEHDQLVLHHQPQIDVRTRRLVGVEALVRWQHPARGIVEPAEFIALAETHGLMGRLTDVVLEQAVRQAAAWRAAGLPLRMSVNLSGSNLLDGRFAERVGALLQRHDLPAGELTLEVTETVLLHESDSSDRVLDALHVAGVDLSIDDFGTGWSSLAYLRRLPVQELKLDASFTRDLLGDHRTAAIVASTIALAHDLGLRVVSEGVEDQATLDRLTTLGCDLSQGYWHARPLPAEELVAFAGRLAAGATGEDPDRQLLPG